MIIGPVSALNSVDGAVVLSRITEQRVCWQETRCQVSQNYIEQCLEILRATHDGDDLAPPDLKLVELRVNGFLNEAGERAFADLLTNVRAGYKPPWFMGVEHLTRDHQRFVYWKGKQVEHDDHDFWRQDGWLEQMKSDAEQLARCCGWLEERGTEVNTRNVLARWRELEAQ